MNDPGVAMALDVGIGVALAAIGCYLLVTSDRPEGKWAELVGDAGCLLACAFSAAFLLRSVPAVPFALMGASCCVCMDVCVRGLRGRSGIDLPHLAVAVIYMGAVAGAVIAISAVVSAMTGSLVIRQV